MTTDPLLATVDPRSASDGDFAPWFDAAEKAKREALAFVAPERVDLSTEASLPLLALEARPTDSKVGVTSKGVIIATRLEGNVTHAATWKPWKEPVRRPPPEPDGEKARVGFGVGAQRVDLRARMPELAWRPGTLLVRLVVAGEVQDTARVELSAGKLLGDPDVRAYLEWAQSQQPPLAAESASPMPMDQHRDEWTPEVPATPGIALNLQPVSMVRPGDQVMLRGAYNLPLRRAELVQPDAPRPTDAQGRTVVARVRITLVFVGEDFIEPTVIPLRFDVRHFAPDLPDGRPCAAGQFRCNLLGHPDTPRMLQRYSVFALSGEQMTGPLPLTLISEDLVPFREEDE